MNDTSTTRKNLDKKIISGLMADEATDCVIETQLNGFDVVEVYQHRPARLPIIPSCDMMDFAELAKMAEDAKKACPGLAQDAIEMAGVYASCHAEEGTTFESIAQSLVDWDLNESDVDHVDRWWESIRKLLEQYSSILMDYGKTYDDDDEKLVAYLHCFYVESCDELLYETALNAAAFAGSDTRKVSKVFLPHTFDGTIYVLLREC